MDVEIVKNPTDDLRGFRRALGQFPTGVTVITTLDANGNPVGVTASSFNSVSIDPPLILWSVAKTAYSATVFVQADNFVVNVLGKQQVAISNACARQGEDKFSAIDYRAGIGQCPVLSGAAAYFGCKTWNLYDGGDHIIVVGEVIEYSYSDSVMPLVFARGSYAVSPPQSVTTKEATAQLPEDGFLPNYLLYQLYRAYSCYSGELYPLLRNEFGISPEEWRVLTALSDVDSIGISQLAALVMQPEEDCRYSLQRLAERDYLVIESNEVIRINRSSSDIAERLFVFAKNHEQTVLNSLDKEQRQMLGSSLKAMVSGFGC